MMAYNSKPPQEWRLRMDSSMTLRLIIQMMRMRSGPSLRLKPLLWRPQPRTTISQVICPEQANIWLYKEDNDDYQYLDSMNILYTYGDKTWNYDKYLAYLYRNYGYTDANTGKWIKFGEKGFIWTNYYTWFYDQTYSYTRKSTGKKVKYSDSDFSMSEFEASQ